MQPAIRPEFDRLTIAHRDIRAGVEEGGFSFTLLNLHL
jgi:hypothetical protein